MSVSDSNKYIAWVFVAVVAVRLGVLPLVFERPAVIAENTKPETTFVQRVSPFASLSLEAESAIVFDVTTGEVLFEKNADAQLPLASITKLMTVLVALEKNPETEVVSIGTHSLEPEGSNGLVLGERWRLDDIIDFTLLSSSNDGARAIAEASGGLEEFITKMNEKAGVLGLEQTYFLNETGLDIGESALAGAYGSVRDVTTLTKYTLQTHPRAFEATQHSSLTLSSLDSIRHSTGNTNEYSAGTPWLIASKTGFTDLAGGNLVVVFDAGLMRPIIATVLGSTKNGRFSDIQKLVNTTFEHIATIR